MGCFKKKSMKRIVGRCDVVVVVVVVASGSEFLHAHVCSQHLSQQQSKSLPPFCSTTILIALFTKPMHCFAFGRRAGSTKRGELRPHTGENSHDRPLCCVDPLPPFFFQRAGEG